MLNLPTRAMTNGFTGTMATPASIATSTIATLLAARHSSRAGFKEVVTGDGAGGQTRVPDLVPPITLVHKHGMLHNYWMAVVVVMT